MRKDPSPLSTYLNAAVIAVGILLGIWAQHGHAAGTPAMKPAHGADPCCDRLDEANAVPKPRVSATLT
jgi:hypothetical protein